MSMDFDGPEQDDDWDDENNESLYLKYGFEGAATLAELSAALRLLAAELDLRAAGGWRLDAPVDGGWAHLSQGEA